MIDHTGDILRDVALFHGGLFTGTIAAVHQAMRTVAHGRPLPRREDLRSYIPVSLISGPQTKQYDGVTVTLATWRGRGGADVFLIDAGAGQHTSATILDLHFVPNGGHVIITARCDRCGRLVTHGGPLEDAEAQIPGSDRAPHCQCVTPGYLLLDPRGVVPRRAAEIRATEAARSPRR